MKFRLSRCRRDSSVQEKVARGASLLDRAGPERWEWHLNIQLLNPRHPYLCVLGQLYGEFSVGLAVMRIGMAGYSSDYGFICERSEAPEVVLAWSEEVSNRRFNPFWRDVFAASIEKERSER